jgi:SagB-type dehydrogenase family enzyme
MQQSVYDQNRYFLKDSIRKTIDFSVTDQSLLVPPPPIEKPHRDDKEQIPLVPSTDFLELYKIELPSALDRRRSRRQFQQERISLTELSFLLWATQGIKEFIGDGHALRTVPSAGARHALETYLAVLNMDSLATGFYRYLPVSHSIMVERLDNSAGQQIVRASLYQNWIATAAVIFIWAAIPYRMEWRYGLAAHRVILIDVGHVCQNLYLACEAIGAGTCAVGAYDQEKMDQVLGLDGNDEFVIYMAPVGKPL